jgi:hypothetical protein
MNTVEAVVINWKRPHNVEQVVRALRGQSTPCTITICDTHPDPRFSLPDGALDVADRMYRWGHNTGPYSRFVPLAAYDHEYTFFVDDDMVPGERCVEHFVDTARSVPDFGVIGQLGRVIPESGTYTPRDVSRLPRAREVDILVRGFFTRTRNLHHVAQLRWLMNYVDEAVPEDDMLLCVAMRLCAGLRNYLTPTNPDPATLMNRTELPDPHALHRRPDHLRRRVAFMRAALDLGWPALGWPAPRPADPGPPPLLDTRSRTRAPGAAEHTRITIVPGPNGASAQPGGGNGVGPDGAAGNGRAANGSSGNGSSGNGSSTNRLSGNGVAGRRRSPSRGVLYLALGADYGGLATDSARTLRLHGYDGPVRVVTDRPSRELVDLECETHVVGELPRGFASRFHKTQLYRWSFDRTLFLDADTVVISPISEIWEQLDGHDMAMAPDMHASVAHVLEHSVNDPTRRAPEYQLMRDLGLTGRRYYNSGVMLFRQGTRTADAFDHWHREWTRFRGEDQLALVRAIAASGLRVRTLDSSWNRRPKAFASVDEARASGVRILHFLSRQRTLLTDTYLGVVAEYLG